MLQLMCVCVCVPVSQPHENVTGRGVCQWGKHITCMCSSGLSWLLRMPPVCHAHHRGLHFLAVQPNPDSDELNGLWLLQDREPPQI